jgi:predicted Zn-dependent peptidase
MRLKMYFKQAYLWPALLLALLFSGCPGPQEARLAADPMAGVSRFDYSGIRIVQQYQDRGYVHLRLYLDRGPALSDPNLAGLEPLAIAGALEGGAGDMNGAEYAARLESLGAEIRHFSRMDYSVIVLNCLPAQLKSTWEVFSQALLNPRFDPTTFAWLQERQIARQDAKIQKGGMLVEQLAQNQALGRGSDSYRKEEAWGTADQIRNYSAGQAKDYFMEQLMQRCRMVLLTSGPVDGEDVADLLFNNLDLRPSENCRPEAISPNLPLRKPFKAIASESTTGGPKMEYVSGILVGEGHSPERMALKYSMAWLLQRKLESRILASGLQCPAEVRVLERDGFPLALSLQSTRGLACAELVLSELRMLRTNGLAEVEWKALRREALTRALLRRESAEAAVSSLAECVLYNSWETCALETDLLQSLTTKSINALLRKELSGITLVYQGDTTRMDRKALANF